MNLSCVQCQQQLPITATFCNQCGRPVDADRDGVPDALGNMIEAKARAIIAEEQRLRDAVVERDRAAIALKKLDEESTLLHTQIEGNARLPRSVGGALFHVAFVNTIMAAIVWLLIGVPVHLFLFALIDFSPAGVALCSSACDGCSGPGRVYAWNYKGSWHTENGRMGYALVCHNREVDIDKLTTTQIRQQNEKLQPYMVSGVKAFFVEGLLLAVGIGLISGLFRARSRPSAYDAERAALQEKLRVNQAARAALGAPVAETTTFRS